jgi:hypothetical protein
MVAIWSNVPKAQQTVDYLEEKLLQHEGLMHTQGLNEDAVDQTFTFTTIWQQTSEQERAATERYCIP